MAFYAVEIRNSHTTLRPSHLQIPDAKNGPCRIM